MAVAILSKSGVLNSLHSVAMISASALSRQSYWLAAYEILSPKIALVLFIASGSYAQMVAPSASQSLYNTQRRSFSYIIRIGLEGKSPDHEVSIFEIVVEKAFDAG